MRSGHVPSVRRAPELTDSPMQQVYRSSLHNHHQFESHHHRAPAHRTAESRHPMRFSAISILLSSLIATSATSAVADEGMWTFDNLPREQIRAKYNFTPDKAWTDYVMRATVNIGGCSASFISRRVVSLTQVKPLGGKCRALPGHHRIIARYNLGV